MESTAGMNVNSVGDQPQGDVTAAAGFTQRSRSPVVQTRQRIEGVGEHANAVLKGFGSPIRVCGAVAEGHRDPQIPQPLNHCIGSHQFWGQGHQRNLRLEAVDAFLQGRQAWAGKMLSRMGSSP